MSLKDFPSWQIPARFLSIDTALSQIPTPAFGIIHLKPSLFPFSTSCFFTQRALFAFENSKENKIHTNIEIDLLNQSLQTFHKLSSSHSVNKWMASQAQTHTGWITLPLTTTGFNCWATREWAWLVDTGSQRTNIPKLIVNANLQFTWLDHHLAVMTNHVLKATTNSDKPAFFRQQVSIQSIPTAIARLT